ncbi:universal stress protein [Halobellus sp. H-GB7]|uniref:universal stress protein n=1 Tax=Halobellus sp. H-GB7 TaxID=3069756 RepID=UPI0027B1A2D6|nr:universal stress protein [Halobellus sp. H-GB7]MDQ2054138.1 universal stress protein [Halobellus sp. H-GB7]
MYDTILVPTDGSDGMARVAEHAIHLARLSEATLHVLHVVDTSAVPLDAHSQSVQEGIEEAGRTSVAEIHDRATDVGIYAITAVQYGTPHQEILAYADENDVDLVVLGTHGRTGLPHVLLGSVAERVVQHSEVPVLTVRTSPAEK